MSFSNDGLDRLREYEWPGNVRELENIVERCVVFTDTQAIGRADIDREIHRLGGQTAPPKSAGSLDSHRAGAERDAILDALARAKDNRTRAARLLGISRRTLYNKLEELGIKD
jgi:DNA-binding NtrC family response regulator